MAKMKLDFDSMETDWLGDKVPFHTHKHYRDISYPGFPQGWLAGQPSGRPWMDHYRGYYLCYRYNTKVLTRRVK
jgi:hypothetical protein